MKITVNEYNELVSKSRFSRKLRVRGSMVIKPYSYAIWEEIQAELDKNSKKLVTQMLISALRPEKFI